MRPNSERYAKNGKRDSNERPRGGTGQHRNNATRNFKRPRNEVANEAEVTTQTDFVIGRHPALEVVNSDHGINKIFIQDGLKAAALTEIHQVAKEKGIQVQFVPKAKLDTLTDGQNHQGVVIAVAPYPYVELDDLFAAAKEKNEDPFFLILDGIEDPHNLGSIMRTADSVGVHGIIIPKRRAVGLTSTVAKTSTGAIEHIPVARVTNLVQTVQRLKKENVWIFGTDMNGTDYRNWQATGAIALVIGNEGKGISALLKKEVDELLTIPMIGHVQSLNASVATGLLLYKAFDIRHPL